MITPMGPGIFLLFHADEESHYISSAGQASFQEYVKKSDFSPEVDEISPEIILNPVYTKQPLIEEKVDLGEISPEESITESRSLADIKIQIAESQADAWPEAIEYISKTEEVPIETARVLFIESVYDELTERVLEDEEDEAILLIMIGAL